MEMNTPLKSTNKGMTLVELMVSLVILAMVATSVAVSSANLIDRARSEKTCRQGAAMVEALERSEGLSIVSDLGPFLDVSTQDDDMRNALNLGRLGYLFSRSARRMTAIIDEEVSETSSVMKNAPFYRTLFRDLLPTNFSAVVGRTLSDIQLANLTNALGSVSLGCGWRGPYCSKRSIADGDGLLRDGFGGLWRCETSPTNMVLVSRGRDRSADHLRAAVPWQDEDRIFEVSTPAGGISLDVSVDESGIAEGERVGRIHVFVYAPVFTVPDTDDSETSIQLGCTHTTADGVSAQIVSGLSAGSRVVFVVAETVRIEDGAFARFHAAQPRRIILKKGVNQLTDMKLVNKSE